VGGVGSAVGVTACQEDCVSVTSPNTAVALALMDTFGSCQLLTAAVVPCCCTCALLPAGIDRSRVEDMESRLKADVLREAARYDQHILVTEEDDDMNVRGHGRMWCTCVHGAPVLLLLAQHQLRRTQQLCYESMLCFCNSALFFARSV
jgi:hypothetical protein